jgi:hypothetical protein
MGQFFPGDMAGLFQTRQDRMQSGKKKEIGLPVEFGILILESFEDLFGELQFRHAWKNTLFRKGRHPSSGRALTRTHPDPS